jgi:hypothetical protein
MTIVENLSGCFLNTVTMLAVPSKTSNNEKKMLIARTAITSSVAVLSIYEYHFQIPGTKKCHIPKPIEMMLPKVVSVFITIFFTRVSFSICRIWSFIISDANV